ncbi:MAG: hypothetical protein KJ052_16990, partial [Candidatus Hydrogenedentes bacterium]|nr:hypothetical protein [Candidatus Hydrogenedentota bacterium]
MNDVEIAATVALQYLDRFTNPDGTLPRARHKNFRQFAHGVYRAACEECLTADHQQFADAMGWDADDTARYHLLMNTPGVNHSQPLLSCPPEIAHDATRVANIRKALELMLPAIEPTDNPPLCRWCREPLANDDTSDTCHACRTGRGRMMELSIAFACLAKYGTPIPDHITGNSDFRRLKLWGMERFGHADFTPATFTLLRDWFDVEHGIKDR